MKTVRNVRQSVRSLVRIGLLSTLAVAALAQTPAVSAGSNKVYECEGKRATIVGTEGHDLIEGTRGDDVIVALGGNDIIYADDGNDTICGGKGDDTIYAEFYYTRGIRTMEYLPDFDTVRGGKGDDYILGGRDDDKIKGDEGNDFVDGG